MLVALGGIVPLGCSPAVFSCVDDAQCEGVGANPRCEPTGSCSREDDSCPSGRRYGERSPQAFAGQCVEPESASTGVADSTASTLGGGVTSSSSETSESGSTATSAAESGTTKDPTTGDPLDPCPGWWDCAWESRVRVTVQSPVDEELEDVPVPVPLDALRQAGPDLRFVDARGEVLPHEVDESTAWVRVPSLPAGAELRIDAYYGNPSAGPQDLGEAVWADPFALVLHGAEIDDAAGNHTPMTTIGVAAVPGVFGNAMRFDGVDDAVVFSPAAATTDLRLDGMTLTAWLRLDPTQSADFPRILDHVDAASASSGWTIALTEPAPGEGWRLRVDLGLEPMEARVTFAEPVPASWFFLAVTISAQDEVGARFDDVVFDPLTPTDKGTALSDAENALAVGRSSHDPERWLSGDLDELRVSRGVRSQAWLDVQFAFGSGDLVSLSAPELRPEKP